MWWIPLAVAAEPLTLTYADTLARAAEQSLAGQSARADVARARAAVLASRSPYDPTLAAEGAWFSQTSESAGQFGSAYSEVSGWSGSATLSQLTATGTSVSLSMDASQTRFLYRLKELDTEFTDDPQYTSSITVRVSQALLQGHRLAYNLQGVRSAEAAADVSEAQARARAQSVLADAAKGYWALHQSRRTEAIAAQTLGIQREQQRVVQALVENGRLAAIERTRIDAAVAQAERALLDAENAVAQAADALLLLLGEPAGREVALLTPPQPPPVLELDEDAVVAAVLAGNADLEAARLAAGSATELARLARHALLPELGLTASGKLNGYEPALGDAFAETFGATLPEYSVGLGLTVPLTNRADRGSVGQREAEAEKARLDVRSLELSLAGQARAQVRALEAARRSVDLAELNVRLAEETLVAERARLSEGRALQKDVIEAVKDLDAARVEAERALIDYQSAVVELERLKGTL